MELTHGLPVRLFAGSLRPLPESGRPTGIYKSPVSGPVTIGPTGFADDQQADHRVHGGPEKAVHLYPLPHYQRLAERFPDLAATLVAGSLGENISAPLTESEVHIGDIFALGSARLQLCQPRNPCWKIDERFGQEGMALFIAEQGIAGWYFRVLNPGSAAPGDTLSLVERPAGSYPLGDALTCLRQHRPDPAALETIAQATGINPAWRDNILDRAARLRTLAAS